MDERPTPNRTDVEIDTYAIVIHEGGQDLHQYEEPIPGREARWIEKCQYDHGEVPPLNLERAQVEQQTNEGTLQSVTLYATGLSTDTKPADTSSNSSQNTDNRDHSGYVIRFSDGQLIPDQSRTVHISQAENMGAAVDYLVRKYDLIGSIELPYSVDHIDSRVISSDAGKSDRTGRGTSSKHW